MGGFDIDMLERYLLASRTTTTIYESGSSSAATA